MRRTRAQEKDAVTVLRMMILGQGERCNYVIDQSWLIQIQGPAAPAIGFPVVLLCGLRETHR